MHTPRNVQGPYTATDFWNQWSSVNPRMTLFVKVTPKSFWTGVSTIGFTSNTRDMTLPGHAGITFKSAPGITPTLAEQALDEPTNLEMTGVYKTGIIEQTDVIAGKWNFSTIEVFSACWDNVNLGELVHFKGNLGEVKDYQTYFTAEGRGLISRLSNDVNKVTSRLCRVKEFRDAECGHTATTVVIGGVTYNVTQTNVTGSPVSVGSQYCAAIFDTSTFAGTVPTAPNLATYAALFTNGKITATSGPNNGVSREISGAAEATGGFPYIRMETKRAFPFPIDTSTTFNLVMGCDRTIEDCKKFSNIVNRRAEDWIPGIEVANRIPNSN